MTDKVLGLTGPSGAGKGEAAAVLAAMGCRIIDTDALVHEVQTPNSPCVQALAAAFSSAVMREDGSLDRQALAALAFADQDAQKRLNAIVHPYIISRTRDILKETNGWAVIDAPLLFESGMDALCTVTVAVLAPEEVRLARILRRDGISEERARQRLRIQPPDAYYAARADVVLHNDGDAEDFRRQVHDWAQPLLREVTA